MSTNGVVDGYDAIMTIKELESLINEPAQVLNSSAICLDHIYVRIN